MTLLLTRTDLRDNRRLDALERNTDLREQAQTEALERLFALLENDSLETGRQAASLSLDAPSAESRLARLRVARAAYVLKTDSRIRRMGPGVFFLERPRSH